MNDENEEDTMGKRVQSSVLPGSGCRPHTTFSPPWLLGDTSTLSQGSGGVCFLGAPKSPLNAAQDRTEVPLPHPEHVLVCLKETAAQDLLVAQDPSPQSESGGSLQSSLSVLLTDLLGFAHFKRPLVPSSYSTIP